MKGYVVRHWRGQQNVLWSFAVNGLTFFLVIVGCEPHIFGLVAPSAGAG